MTTVEATARGKERAVSKRGFGLGILGAAVYLVGTFLPGISGNFEGGSSSAVALAFAPGVPGALIRFRVGAFFLLFGTMLVVAAISLAGVRSVRTTRWNAALAGASAIWFVPTLSRVLRWFSADFRFPNGIGTWAMYAGTGLAFAGGVVALIELRATSGDARTGSSGIVGFILGVLGVAVYGFSTSLTYFAQPPAPGPISLFSGLKHLPVVPTIAAVISVYGAAAVLAVISFGGMWGRRKDLWAAALLAGALAWSPKLAELINASVYEIGFWGVEAATVILLAAGAIAVAGTRRSSIASASTSEHAARDEP